MQDHDRLHAVKFIKPDKSVANSEIMRASGITHDFAMSLNWDKFIVFENEYWSCAAHNTRTFKNLCQAIE